MRHILSVDMGGTKILGGIISADGAIIREQQIPTYPTPDSVPFEQLCKLIAPLIDDSIEGISIGIPGAVPDDSGVVHIAPALNWDNFPLKAHLQAKFEQPIKVENDVNLAALGEVRYGAGKGWRDAVCVAVGTGIGAGIVLDGKLYRGKMGAAGEVGYMLLGREFLRQHYEGDFGALESVAGGAGIAQQAQQLGYDVDTVDVFIAAENGEQWAINIIDAVVDYLAMMVTNITMLLAPEGIILSGSVITHNPDFLPRMLAALEGRIPFLPELRLSTLGAKAALLGGAATFYS